jgi:hypothetical protein
MEQGLIVDIEVTFYYLCWIIYICSTDFISVVDSALSAQRAIFVKTWYTTKSDYSII